MQEGKQTVTIGPEEENERADVALAKATGLTRATIQRLMKEERVTLGGKLVKANQRFKEGDEVTILLPEVKEATAQPLDIPIKIVYEDKDIAVIDKPQGMVVHPAPGHEQDTLVNAVLYHIKDLSGVGGVMRPGIVHRIDKMTSGLLVIAKNDQAHLALSGQLKDHSMRRTYAAIVDGNIKEDTFVIDAPIARHPKDRKKMAVDPKGRNAVTHVTVLDRFGSYTLVKAELETGRTHQIRVHMTHIKHPVSGDCVYGPEKNRLGLEGQALHAMKLTLAHPSTGEEMSFVSKPHDYFLKALVKAGWDNTPFWPED